MTVILLEGRNDPHHIALEITESRVYERLMQAVSTEPDLDSATVAYRGNGLSVDLDLRLLGVWPKLIVTLIRSIYG